MTLLLLFLSFRAKKKKKNIFTQNADIQKSAFLNLCAANNGKHGVVSLISQSLGSRCSVWPDGTLVAASGKSVKDKLFRPEASLVKLMCILSFPQVKNVLASVYRLTPDTHQHVVQTAQGLRAEE